jgi:hypothetical protein
MLNQAPSGIVIRTKYFNEMHWAKRYFRKSIPFLGLAFPIVLLRSRLDYTNGYKN